MPDVIIEIFSYRFMQLSLAACILASIGCGLIGALVVVRRIGFVAGGIAHTVLAGIGIAVFLRGSPSMGAVIAALSSAVLIGWIKLRWRQDEDILIAAFWSVGMAVGILFMSRTPGYGVDLMSYLFGNILLITTDELVKMALLDMAIVALLLLFYKQIVVSSFDEEFARLRGLHVEAIYILMLCMVALTVVLLIQIVGIILVIALLVLPAASAAQFATSVSRLMALSVLFSMLVTVSGLLLSYQPDLPSGSSIVLLAGVFYLVCVISRTLWRRHRKRVLAGWP
ncbi:MAG TPA: metal ABC transporter permease [Gammaproteobacteria bacterium]|nr:metal ABC transporter permease [Gammaproteobacteria bacterium]